MTALPLALATALATAQVLAQVSPVVLVELRAWLLAFAFTQAVEIPIYRRAGAPLWVAFGASALTHPVVWFVFPRAGLGWIWMVAWAELFAWLAEAVWLRWHKVKRPLVWSLVANGASLSLGLLSREVFGVP